MSMQVDVRIAGHDVVLLRADADGELRSACSLARVNVVRANGLELAYERVGEGPPLVFVHGAAEDGRIWQPQLAALADEFTVVAWDEPGAGQLVGCARRTSRSRITRIASPP